MYNLFFVLEIVVKPTTEIDGTCLQPYCSFLSVMEINTCHCFHILFVASYVSAYTLYHVTIIHSGSPQQCLYLLVVVILTCLLEHSHDCQEWKRLVCQENTSPSTAHILSVYLTGPVLTDSIHCEPANHLSSKSSQTGVCIDTNI